MKKMMRTAVWIVAGLVALVAAGIGAFVFHTITYFRRSMTAVWRAGFVEKQVTINGSEFNYAEGPDNGPALLLIHGQGVDWQNYARVLPDLAAHYHVFAVDCYGHGRSARVPEKYTAAALGSELAQFMREVIGETAVVSGHSSGGLLAVWLAANAPDTVRGVVLEDPPLFTTTLPRAAKTWNYVDLATTAHNFVQSSEPDFVTYQVRHGKFYALFKELQPRLTQSVLTYRAKHPHEPVKVFYMPPVMNELWRGLQTYDPQFGVSFYDGSWNDGFDQADALRRIGVPAVLIHTNWQYDEDGILMAAMDDKDAERARSLIPNVEFVKVDSGHGFHFEKPNDFVQIMVNFLPTLRETKTH
ncbi:MAG: alpha/beta hydrolase [Ardenticatenaceae bacterium]|nr:alpha/beta hydrolase [Ardenticatenaceae bacterium]